MAKQLINLGTTPNDRSGDTLRDAGSKMNNNANEIYTALGNGTNLQVSVAGATTGQVLKFNGTTFVPQSDQNTDAVTSVNTQIGAVVLDTDDISEGSTNQYFTTERARAAISASGALSYNSTSGALTFTQGNTDTVPEGTTNLYFSQGRFNFALSQANTNGLPEGSNNYYFTTARARAAISGTQNVTYNPATGVITGPVLSTVAASGSYNDLTDKPPLGSTTQWTVDTSGTALNLTGNGFLGTEDNPTIYVYRGMRYEFNNEAGAALEFVDATEEGVRSVVITEGGLYSTAPTVSFTGGTGSGAAGTAVLSTTGSIDTVTVTDGGSGYSQTPTVTFNGGTGATATATLTSTGPIESLNIVDAGSGYTTAPTVTFTATTGSGATAETTIGFGLASIAVDVVGANYTTANIIIAGDGTGATATATIVDGEITAITVDTAGSGYTSVPTVSIVGDGTGAEATATLETTGSIKTVSVTASGSGYSSDVVAVVSGNANITVNRSLSIDTITVTAGGSGYPSNTTVNITPAVGDAITQSATATATLQFPVASVTITNPGTYTVAPTVAFASGVAEATAEIDLKLVPANQDFTAATAANNGSAVLCPLMSTATGTQWKYRLVGDESTQVGDIVVV